MSGRSPTWRSKMMAPGTIGTLAPLTSKPTLCSYRYFRTPVATSRPNALPPERNTACTCCTRFTGSSRSVSIVPGADPRTSTPATAPASDRITVQPVGRSPRVKCPTLRPGTSVSPEFIDMPDALRPSCCRATGPADAARSTATAAATGTRCIAPFYPPSLE